MDGPKEFVFRPLVDEPGTVADWDLDRPGEHWFK